MDSEAIYIAPHHSGTPGQFIAWLHQPGKPDFPMAEGSEDDCVAHVRETCCGIAWENVDAYIKRDGAWQLIAAR